MTQLTNFPAVIFAVSFLVLWISGRIGTSFRNRRKYKSDNAANPDSGLVLASTLTLLGLIIGFTFSMATNRYEQRKNYEEAEANAIGTEYVRADDPGISRDGRACTRSRQFTRPGVFQRLLVGDVHG